MNVKKMSRSRGRGSSVFFLPAASFSAVHRIEFLTWIELEELPGRHDCFFSFAFFCFEREEERETKSEREKR